MPTVQLNLILLFSHVACPCLAFATGFRYSLSNDFPFRCALSWLVFQLLNKAHGGDVAKEQVREDGQCDVSLDTSCELFHGLSKNEQVVFTLYRFPYLFLCLFLGASDPW